MMKKDKLKAFLGENTSFEGKLTFEDTIQIDGYFKGDILASGNLVVGRKGVLHSDIHVNSAVINGEVRGNLVADNFVELRVPCRMVGNIQSPIIIVQKGVSIEGHCLTAEPKIADKSGEDVDLVLNPSDEKLKVE